MPRPLLHDIISSVAQRVQLDEPLITKYDTIAGDGDCGTTLLTGANGTPLANRITGLCTC